MEPHPEHKPRPPEEHKRSKYKLRVSYHVEKWYCLLCPLAPGGNMVILYASQDSRKGLTGVIEEHLRKAHHILHETSHWHADHERSTYVETSDLDTGEWQATQTATFVLPEPDGREAVLHVLIHGMSRP